MANTSSVILKHISANGKLTGCVYLQKQEDKLYLGMLTVSPEMQGLGIGKRLLKAAEDYALEQNCQAIDMTVITIRTELINWYERHGYRKTGETKPFPSDPRYGIAKQLLEFYVMTKRLYDKELQNAG
jgi:ribosomal protein S18 acetylase RimI-like enzyme